MENQLPNNSKTPPERKAISTEQLSEQEYAELWPVFPAKSAICDRCKGAIDSAYEGLFEWIEFWSGPYRDSGGYDLRLVHTYHYCRFNRRKEYERDGGQVCDESLVYFFEPDGLQYLGTSSDDPPIIQDIQDELIRHFFRLGKKEVYDESNLS